MASITFRAKARDAEFSDCPSALYVTVPIFTRSHCDMSAFRQHKKYEGLANSDLFPALLKRIRAELFPAGWVRLDQLPENVTVKPGFLHTITIEV